MKKKIAPAVVVAVLSASVAGAQQQPPAHTVCKRIELRSASNQWSGYFAFDTAGLMVGKERPFAENGPGKRGRWKIQSNDSLWINIGFIDSGFEIVLAGLSPDSVAGHAISWSVSGPPDSPESLSAMATRVSCPIRW